MGSEKHLKIVMFPWLAHGHISPFLELSKRLISLSDTSNFLIYICSTPINLNSIKNNIPEKYSQSIQFLDLNLLSSPELPPHYHTTNGLPLHLHSNLRKALKMAKPNLTKILKTLQPDLLMHDIILTWAGALASKLNIPSVSFFTSGAAMFSYFCHLGRHPGLEFPFPAIRLRDFELSMALSNRENFRSEGKDPDEDEAPQRNGGVVFINSSREMEGKYIDYLSELIDMKIIPVGALVQDPDFRGGEDDGDGLMDWLGKKEESSSVFVSFGSEYFLEKEDIEEIAYGLEISGVNFIWIIRFPKGEEMEIREVLPKGFLERVGERGRIVEKWAPQAKILKHRSIGGFVSHCGWNSLMEGVDYGVPIIAMPMHLDQPMNAKLVAELGVGVEVERDEKGKIQREKIAEVIRDVVLGEIGEISRKNIERQRESVRSRSRREMEGVVEKIAALCEEKNNSCSFN